MLAKISIRDKGLNPGKAYICSGYLEERVASRIVSYMRHAVCGTWQKLHVAVSLKDDS